MGADSNIEWTDHTFNPWRGCTKVSPGCANCYAEKLSKRNPGVLGVWGPKGRRVIAAESYWKLPLRWNREAEEAGKRRRVFCASLADVFEGPESMREEDRPVVAEARMKLFALIAATPHLDWLLLTKRPENASDWLNQQSPAAFAAPGRRHRHWYDTLTDLIDEGDGGFFRGPEWDRAHAAAERIDSSADFLPNVWLGTSVEDQRAADERIPHLLRTPATVRFLSCEPILGRVDLTGFRKPLAGGIHWVIAGGESGPCARPMHPDWVRSLRDQCQAADVPFFFKQWGEWAPRENDPRGLDAVKGLENIKHHDEFHEGSSSLGWVGGITTGPAQHVVRVGKKAAGRILDGVTHDAVPAASR